MERHHFFNLTNSREMGIRKMTTIKDLPKPDGLTTNNYVFEVEKGMAFLCIKDYIMDDDTIDYKKGKTYYVNNLLKDEWFNLPGESLEEHTMKIDDEFWGHFKHIPLTEIDFLKPKEINELPETAKNEYDYINPNHYKGFSKETIDMMVDIWGKEAVAIHCEITAFKYKMRLGSKPDQPIERDLEKANWYLNKAKELRQ